MSGSFYTTKAILNGIMVNDNDIIEYLYLSFFEMVKDFVLSNNGKIEDAEDIFQDSLIVVYKKLITEKLELTCSLKTYIFSVSKNLWLKRLREKRKSNIELKNDKINKIAEAIESDKGNDEQKIFNLYQKHFYKLSADCQKVLRLFLKKVPLKEIRRIMGFSSTDYTKTRKYLCKKNLKERILNDPEYRTING